MKKINKRFEDWGEKLSKILIRELKKILTVSIETILNNLRMIKERKLTLN